MEQFQDIICNTPWFLFSFFLLVNCRDQSDKTSHCLPKKAPHSAGSLPPCILLGLDFFSKPINSAWYAFNNGSSQWHSDWLAINKKYRR